MQDEISLTILKWGDYQPRKDLKELTWFRVDSAIFNGETYFHLKNEGIIVFLFLLTKAAEKNSANIKFTLDFVCQRLNLKMDVILSAIEKLKQLQLVHNSVQVCTETTPTIQTIQTIQTNNTNKHNNTNIDFDFESAYFLYPLKKGKSGGLKTLVKKIKTDQDFENFKIAVQNYKKDLEINKTGLQFTKHFSTFCNEWQDWVEHIPVANNFNKSKTEKVFDAARDQIKKIENGEL